MKKIYLAAVIFSFIGSVNAQDEGAIVKKERFNMAKGIFIAGGPSFTLSKDIGDYSSGYNVELGYLKRLNRVISIGPSISYISFKYDPTVTSTGYNNVFVGGPYQDGETGYDYYQGLYFKLSGGDISLISASCNVKLNLIPVTNTTIFSVYIFAKPFVSISQRKEVKGQAVLLRNDGDPNASGDWYVTDTFDWTAHNDYVKNTYGVDVGDDLKAQSTVTGGVFIGPGIEFIPAKKVSIFLQSSIGYTLPVSFVNSKKYNNSENLGNDLDYFIQNGGRKYPTYKKGFSSVNVQLGVSFNF